MTNATDDDRLLAEKATSKDSEDSGNFYRIGAVSRLTGIPSDTLRVWERRYGVVEPVRTGGGNRHYTQEHVDRLSLIKLLVDQGHAISTVANLDLEQLRERAGMTVQASSDEARVNSQRPLRLVVLGVTLPIRLQADLVDHDGGIDVIGNFLETGEFERHAADLRPDLLVLEQPVLDDRTVATAKRLQRHCRSAQTLVVYGFGRSQQIQSLLDQHFLLLRYPATLQDILAASVATHPAGRRFAFGANPPTSLEGPIPLREFTDTQLGRITTLSSALKCECPHHLADLVMSLSRFEQYSADCENQSAADAALHSYLHRTTANARAMLEGALRHLMEVEGLTVGAE